MNTHYTYTISLLKGEEKSVFNRTLLNTHSIKNFNKKILPTINLILINTFPNKRKLLKRTIN